jgi:hypothetical protein
LEHVNTIHRVVKDIGTITGVSETQLVTVERYLHKMVDIGIKEAYPPPPYIIVLEIRVPGASWS